MIKQSRIPALIAITLMLIVALVSFRELQSLASNSEWVSHTYEVIQRLDAARQGLIAAESQQRGYILTGDPALLNGYTSSRQTATENLDAVQRLTVDNPGQQRRVPAARAALLQRIELLDHVIDVRRRSGQSEAVAIIASGQPADATARALAALDDLRDTESQLLRQRSTDTAKSARRSAITLIALTVVAVSLLLAAAIIIRRHLDALTGANEALERTNAELARENTRRQRAESELAKRADELARSNADLEQFAYVASHDLQEPLRMVASYTELLGRRYRGRLDQDADEFIAFAIDGAKRMQALIADLLQYARLSNEAMPVGQPVDLSAVVDDVVRLYDGTISETAARVEREALPTVAGSPTLLRQLFRNLIGNALKFRHPDRPPLVHIGAVAKGDQWEVTVADNGIGVQPEFKDRIFAIFQRLHSRERYPGTGMGLTICKRIVEKHGGAMWVEPAPVGGAAFHLTLHNAANSDTSR